MNKLSILAFAIVVAAGCGKKKEEPSASDKTTEMGKDTKPANPETATKPGDDTKTEAPVAPPVGALEDVKTISADAPKECQDAYAAYKKLHDCDKVAPDAKKGMVKAWNLGTVSSIEQLPNATAEQKKTIIDGCAKMVDNAAMLTKDCP